MVYNGILKGKYVYLKSATLEDAINTLKVRQDPSITKYLPKLDISVDDQRNWLRKQRVDPTDYFFCVRNINDDSFTGTVSIYHIDGDEAEGGRLTNISRDPYNVFESSLLVDDFAFDVLRLKRLHGFIYEGNKRAIKLNRQLGFEILPSEKDENGDMIHRIFLTKENYKVAKRKIESIIYHNI